ncbi:MAG TPA: alkaline phosphatase family protein [Methanocella sp.]|uniref:alkaline phosphatase family protein n=1 Tax=Methanocella sp. TaxID=2052833 RepID=UPI002C77D22F|nr:alkaline phosphatase family protein [Methanocella sp.]HTY89681.1 alkaline phosphatase family protein [Methanocella sp.]
MKLSPHFVDPASYGTYSLSCIPGTILSALTPETPERRLPDDALDGRSGKYDRVVLIVIDGLGFDHFRALKKSLPFLKELCRRGNSMRLGTQFPSTTACNVTTLNTGQTVAKHGIFEWFYYEPAAGEIIAPLLYSCGRRIHERNSLLSKKSVKPEALYPEQSFYRKLAEHGVRSYTFQDAEYASSEYTNVVLDGAARYGFLSPSDGLVNLAKAAIEAPAKAYFYFYFDKVDSLSHHYGPGSPEALAEAETFIMALERLFWDRVADRLNNTLFMLTADHGQASIDPSKCVYLNVEFPELKGCMKKSKSGRYLAPAGSCRDMFLYIKDDRLDGAYHLLADGLHGKAAVAKTTELIENGYFGEPYISEALEGRLGNLVILPYENECVWWYKKGLFEIDFLGHHGGLTKPEMEIPFMAWDL